MSLMEIAVEIGTSNTSIFVAGNGIVLREPTIVAFLNDGKRKKLLAVGNEAYAMLGKTPEKTQLMTPVTDGVISDPNVCLALLRSFLKKVLPDTYFLPRIRFLVGIPTGLTADERRMYEDIMFSACPKVKEVVLVENIILSAVGIDLPIDSATGGFIADIGGGTTEVAAINFCGIVSGCGLNVGGGVMDRAILDGIAGQHNLMLGLASVRKLKHEIGSLYDNDLAAQPVNGIDVRTKSIGSALVSAADLYEVLQRYYIIIGEAIESIINMCPPDVAGEFNKKGIYAVGGASRIPGLSKFLTDRLGIDVYVPENPEYATILGAGKVMSNGRLLDAILAHK